MDRRSFLKGSALALVFAPLLPRLAEGRGPGLIGTPRIDHALDWCVCEKSVIDLYDCWSGRERVETSVHYRGTPKAIFAVAALAARRLPEDLCTMSHSQDVDYITDALGNVATIVTLPTQHLVLTLMGYWLVEVGPVESGRLNVQSLAYS